MALQYKNDPRVEGDTHGYSAGISSGAINDWTDVALNGSHTSVIYWDDGAWGGSCVNNQSRVYMTVTDEWSASINDDTNAITIHVKTSFSMNRQAISWGGNSCDTYFCMRDIYVYTGRGGGEIARASVCMVDTGIFLTGSREFDITLQHGESTKIGSFFVRNNTRGYEDTYYDILSAGLRFNNTLPAPKYPPSANSSCSAYSSGGVVGGTSKLGNIDYGCPSGNDCSANLTTIQLFSDSEYANKVSEYTTTNTTATVEYKGLSPNHKYYVKYTITNGKYTQTYTCSFITMASSYPYGYRYLSDQASWIYVQINNGDDECDITTRLYIREKGTSDWQLIDTTTSEETVRETLRNLIIRGKKYESYSTTENCSGLYTSAIYEFAPPAADSIIGVVTDKSSTLQPSGLLADIDYCYKVTSYVQEEVSEDNPMTSHLEYSRDQVDWVHTDDVTSTVNPDTICGTLTGLQCGTTYYLRSWQKVGNVSSYSAVVQITTPTCADFNNCVCDNLHYMTELICQQLFRMKKGQKTIYANCDTKKLCDPYSNNPTIASILSRLLRYDQAVACLVCSMEALDIFKTGETDQVFTASEPGSAGQFITMDYYPTEGNDNLVTSSGVAQAIQEYIQSVFHPIGSYAYYAEDTADLDEQSACDESGESGEPCETPSEGDKAVIGKEYYTYTDGLWVLTGEVPNLGDLAVITILKGTNGGKNFYWWNDKWNLMNLAGAGGIEERIETIEQCTENSNIVYSYDEDKHYKITTVPNNYTDEDILVTIKPDAEFEIVIFTTIDQLPPSDIVVTPDEQNFHQYGTFDYFSNNNGYDLMADAAEGLIEADANVVVCGDDITKTQHWIHYGNGLWDTLDDMPDALDDYAVISITKGNFAGNDYYWLNDKWNLKTA